MSSETKNIINKDFIYYYNFYFCHTPYDNQESDNSKCEQDEIEKIIRESRNASWVNGKAIDFVNTAVMCFIKGLGIKNGENIQTEAEKYANMFVESRSKLCQDKKTLLAMFCGARVGFTASATAMVEDSDLTEAFKKMYLNLENTYADYQVECSKIQ